MAPDARRVTRPAGDTDFVMAVKLEVDGNFAKALPFFEQPSLRRGSLGEYAEYYAGLAQLRVGRAEEARRTFQALASKDPVGYLAEAIALREADCDEALGDHSAAVAVYEKLSKSRGISVEEILIR